MIVRRWEWSLLLSVLCGTAPALAPAATGRARQHVRDGIERFAAGDYPGADKAFAEADVTLPDDPRVTYDRACVHTARGDADKAIELFRKAAQTRDAALLANCHYNLGCVLAAKAKAALGAPPAEAAPEARTAGMQQIAAAVGHFRDCLKVDPGHAGARHNLEVLRLWVKHMQDVWSRRDREKRREEMDLLALLQMLETEQGRLRQGVQAATREADSPRRRQGVRQAQTAQRELAEEIPPLKEKLKQTLQPPVPAGSPAASQPPAATDQTARALTLFNELADRAHTAMQQATGNLEKQDLTSAAEAQTAALDALNELYMGVAPLPHIVQKAIGNQEGLVQQSKEMTASQDRDTQAAKPDKPCDTAELARQQTYVARWSEILKPKAEEQLKQMAATPVPAGPPAANPSAQSQKTQQDAEGLTLALQKALELGPRVQVLTEEAAAHLKKQEVPAALPKQEEALKLLREIAQSLPQQQPNQDQEQDQKPSPQQDKPQQPPQPQSAGKDKQSRDLSQQQAEAMLRKVRQREREHREREKQQQGYLHGGITVDKDW